MEKQFAFTKVICKLGKISNNLEKHGDEDVVVFAVPVTGIVDVETANAIAGDEHFGRSVFNDNRGFLEPMPWCRAPIRFPDKYEGALATFDLPGDEVLEYRDSRIKDIDQTPTPGGMVQVDFQLQVKPELDRGNLLLQEYQHREVTLSIADAKVALKKTAPKSGDLELVGGGKAPEPEAGTQGDNYDHDEARRIEQKNETERQLGEALRGLEGNGSGGNDDEDLDDDVDAAHGQDAAA